MSNKIIDILENILEHLKFGSITITVMDGKIVMVEFSEKVKVD